ncbi:MAG TPA: succinate--CoA ligase subunit alpha [Ignavibacteriales bacterium]|nr:succinate--CoA ligase subunit alpha [Ignavibacteriales bacterium]
MSILVDNKTRLVVQGITGGEGSFHTQQMVQYGTNVVAGVTPGKGGQKFDNIPVYNTVEDAVKAQKANASVIFVPPAFAADAILEAAQAGIKLIICITEGIPAADMVKVYNSIKNKDVRLIGPNCPGVISPGKAKIGIMPGFIHKAGKVGVVSRSGTLTYEAVKQLTDLKIGQSTCVGIGGDPVVGSQFIDIIKLFNEDAATEGIIMIGEIGGSAEEEAAQYIKKFVKKPVVGFIAGRTAPAGRRMGHAGAIISGGKGTAAEKMAVMKKAGIKVVESPAEIGITMQKALEQAKQVSKAPLKSAQKGSLKAKPAVKAKPAAKAKTAVAVKAKAAVKAPAKPKAVSKAKTAAKATAKPKAAVVARAKSKPAGQAKKALKPKAVSRKK